jgi:hypothetical protein
MARTGLLAGALKSLISVLKPSWKDGMHCYKLGVCDRQGEPGSGSPLFYINTWAMVWPHDYPAVAT